MSAATVYRFGRNKEFRIDLKHHVLYRETEDLHVARLPLPCALLEFMVLRKSAPKIEIIDHLYKGRRKPAKPPDAVRKIFEDLCKKILGADRVEEFFYPEGDLMRWQDTQLPEEVSTTGKNLNSYEPTFPAPGHYYYIVARGTNLALDVKLASKETGKVFLWNLPGWNNNQLWQLSPPFDGYFALRAKHSSLSLDVDGAKAELGTALLQHESHGEPNQQWSLKTTRHGFFKLYARHSGQCLDRDELGFGFGANVQMWDENKWPNQEWDFIRQDHLAVGQEFIIDPRLAVESESGAPAQVLHLGIELARRRATFKTWLTASQIAADSRLEELSSRFHDVFGILPDETTPFRATVIAALANPNAIVLAAAHDVEGLAQTIPSAKIYPVRMSDDLSQLTIAALDLATPRTGDIGHLSDIMRARLLTLWQQCAAVWEDVEPNQALPEQAMVGGEEANGDALYVARAFHRGGWHPGKVVNGMCHFPYGDAELIARDFQVPQTVSGEWIQGEEGHARVLIAGCERGKPLVLCKAEHRDEKDDRFLGVHPGKVVNGVCEITYGGSVFRKENYQVFRLENVNEREE